MAVEDKFVDADIEAGKLGSALAGGFAGLTGGNVLVQVAAADDDGSKYRLFKNMSPDLVPIAILIQNDAITGGTDYDLGLYIGGSGAVKDADILVDGADLSSAGTNVYHLVDPANTGKALFELAGDTVSTKEDGYDIVLTANTVGSAAGDIAVAIVFAQGR